MEDYKEYVNTAIYLNNLFPWHSFFFLSVIRSVLTADWLYCLLGGTERHISRLLKLYWQVSRTDGCSPDKLVREWLLVKRLANWGLHYPINQGYLASSGCYIRSSKVFIMNPQGEDGSVCGCGCPYHSCDLITGQLRALSICHPTCLNSRALTPQLL